MTNLSPKSRPLLAGLAVVVGVAIMAAPTALSALSGSGNVTDIVQLSTTTASLSTLASSPTGASASGAPVTSGLSAFTVTNSGSNVDTFVRYDWSATPYYGGNASQTSITLRGATQSISDLLWFRQSIVTNTGLTTSDYYAPIVLRSDVARATFTTPGNACASWTGSAASFTPTATGYFTFRYYDAASQTDDTPSTSDTFYYCLDTTNTSVYIGKSTDFDTATRVESYGTNSAEGVLKGYQVELLSGAQTEGNHYCLIGYTGSGTGAAPSLAQCEKLPYETAGSTAGKLFVLYDPPAYFPSVNQGGALTYAVSGTQWNPYASTTTNSA